MEEDPYGPGDGFDLTPEQWVAWRVAREARELSEHEHRRREEQEKDDVAHVDDMAVLTRTLLPELAARTAVRLMCTSKQWLKLAENIPIRDESVRPSWLRRLWRVKTRPLVAWFVDATDGHFIYIGRDGQIYGDTILRRTYFFKPLALEELHYHELQDLKEGLERLLRSLSNETTRGGVRPLWKDRQAGN